MITRGIISFWTQELKEYNFFLCYRGILVNLAAIQHLSGRQVILKNEEHLPISRNYYKKIREQYLNRIIIYHNI